MLSIGQTLEPMKLSVITLGNMQPEIVGAKGHGNASGLNYTESGRIWDHNLLACPFREWRKTM